VDFLVPKLSATMESAKVLRWLKRVGEAVKQGEPLVEIETDKAAMEVEAPVAGLLSAVFASEGAEVAVGARLAALSSEGDAASDAPRPAIEQAAPAAQAAAGAPMPRMAATDAEPRVLASPYARTLARLHAIDLGALAGADPAKRVRAKNVLSEVEKGAAVSALRAPEPFEPLSPMRAQIAAAVALSRRTIPSFVLDRWVETAAIEAARARALAAPAGVKPTLNDFLIHACAAALVSHPAILDRWREEGGSIGRARASRVDIGLVVALPDGLAIPVLHDLAGKTIGEIAALRAAAVERARSGRLLQSDYAPVSLSISNLGKSGADRFEAIVNPGQSGILAVGRRHERVVARSGAIAIAAGVNLTFSADHRLIDGVAGAAFLETLASVIEERPAV
jgi:pyruvate dehydrogenase E2 component (dihydrolipoamide acetyltransferase)